MPKRNDAWGIELGANALKAVRLQRNGAEAALADYVVLPFKKVLSTPDTNVEEEIKVKLEEFKSLKDLRKTTNILSVPGHMAFARFAKLPPVEPKQINNIVRFEAQQQIPFPIDQVEWDHHVFMRPDSPDVEVGIFAITKERINQYLKVFRDLKIPIHGVTLSPLAVYNAYCYDQQLKPDSPGMILLDIGTTATDMIIVENGRIWLRPLPIGGNQFTDALVKSFKLSFSKAEKYKAEAATSKYSKQIFQAMRPVFADLVQEMQRSMGFYQSINRDANIQSVTCLGSTFRVPGLQKFLKQQLQMEVKRPDSYERIKPDDKEAAQFSEDVINLATAYGLALQGVGLATVNANILPMYLIKQRVWSAKQPWFAAAAATVAVSVGVSWGVLFQQQSQYASESARTEADVKASLSLANGFIAKWKQIEGGADPRVKVENLRRILDYRDIWPKIMHDLELAVRSLDPQAVLVDLNEPNYKAMVEIPREQRRRIYIDSITTEYRLPGQAGAGKADVGTASNMKVEDIWGERQAAQPGEAVPEKSDKPTIPPPSFVITIKGTTPYAEGPRFLDQTIVRWIRENSSRPNRPYRLVLENNQALYEVYQIGGLILNPAGGGKDSGGPGGRPTPGGRPGARPQLNPRETAAPVAAANDVLSLLPSRPMVNEPATRDWKFELRWTVQLLRPEDARVAEDSTHEAPANVNPQPGEAAPNTPTAPTAPATGG